MEEIEQSTATMSNSSTTTSSVILNNIKSTTTTNNDENNNNIIRNSSSSSILLDPATTTDENNVGCDDITSAADSLLVECEAYMAEVKTQLITLPFSAFSRIKSWRVKRRDDRLCALYDALQPRIHSLEQALRKIIDDAVEKKSLLRISAGSVYMDLEEYIGFSQEKLAASEPLVGKLRDFVDSITTESSSLKSMVSFDQEILRQQLQETIVKNCYAQPWVCLIIKVLLLLLINNIVIIKKIFFN